MGINFMHEGGTHIRKRLLTLGCIIALALALQMMVPMLAGATNFSITVQDGNGNPVPNVRVAVGQWGYSVSAINTPNDSQSAINFTVLDYYDYWEGSNIGPDKMYSWGDFYLEVSAPGYETKYISKAGVSQISDLMYSRESYFSVSEPDIELDTVTLEKTGLIKGKITNQSGEVVPYAQVLLYNTFEPDSAPYTYSYTEEDGTYSIAAPEGSYRLIAYDSSGVYLPTFFGDTQYLHESTLMNLNVTEDCIADIKMLKSGTIRGKVTDFESKSLKNVKVYATQVLNADNWEWSEGATTDASGEYCITRLQTGKHSVQFSKKGYVEKFYDGSSEGTENYEEQDFVKVSLQNTVENCNASLDKNPVVSGAVSDASGNPLSNIHVVFYDMNSNGSSAHGVYTDENGNYATEKLREGSYRVGFQDPYNKEYATKYYADTPNVSTIDNASTITVQNNSSYPSINGVMTERLHIVDGRITDEDGHPVSGLRVSLYKVDGYYGDSAHWAETNAEGWYFVEGVDSGRYYVGVHDFINRAYSTAYYGNTALLDDAKEITVTNASLNNIDITVKSRGYIKGKVVDLDGKPIPNLTIGYLPDEYDSGASSHSVLSAKDGTYIIKGADAGKGTLRFSDFYSEANNLSGDRPNGFYATQYFNGKATEYTADKLRIKAGEVTEVGITKISGRHKAELIFKDGKGNILPNQEFVFYGNGVGSRSYNADENGRYLFESLDNGRCYAEVEIDDTWYFQGFTVENQDVVCVVTVRKTVRIPSSIEGMQTFDFGYQVDINIPAEDKPLFGDAYIKGSIWHENDLRGLEFSLNFQSAVAKPLHSWTSRFTQNYFIEELPEYVTADITLPEEFNVNAPGMRVKYSNSSGDGILQQTPLGEPKGDVCFALLEEDGSKIRIYTKESIHSLEIDSLRSVTYIWPNGGEGTPEFYGSLVSRNDYIDEQRDKNKITTGWYTDKELTHQWDFSKDRVFDDIKLYAKVVPVRTVAFDSKGGSEVESQRVGAGELICNAAPVRPNYTFGGWYKNSELTQIWDMDNDRVSESMVLYAKWTPSAYSISYVTDGGTMPNDAKKRYEYGEEFNLPTPERAGYSFEGWYDNGDFEGEEVEKVTSSDTGKLHFYAKWVPRTYTLAFDLKGGAALEDAPTTYTYGTEKGLPTPTREHFNFAGWYDNADFSGTPYASVGIKNPGNLNLVAKWNATKYTVVFDPRGGSAVQAQDVEYGSLATRPADPTLTGNTFGGWYKESGCINAWDFSTDTVKRGTTIYAKWKINTYNVSFINGASTVTKSVPYNTTTSISSPLKSGYKFMGWYTTGGAKFSSTSPVQANATYYARFYSTNAYLKKRTASTGTWSNKFSKTRYSYTLTLARTKPKVKLTAYKAQTKAKVYWSYNKTKWYSGATKTISISKGKTKYLYFKVKAQSGATKIYKIKVYRKR